MKITLTSHFMWLVYENDMKKKKKEYSEQIFSKKLPLAWTTSSRWYFLQAIPTVSLFKLPNAAIIFTFSLSLLQQRSFIGLSVSYAPHIIIREIAIWGVGRLDVKGDVVAEIYSQPRLGPLACVAWSRVLSSNTGSSISSLLDPNQHYFF